MNPDSVSWQKPELTELINLLNFPALDFKHLTKLVIIPLHPFAHTSQMV